MREAGIWLLPPSSPPKQVPDSPPLITIPATQEQPLETEIGPLRKVEDGLSGHLEAGEGRKRERETGDHTGRRCTEPAEAICHDFTCRSGN